ncbi:MAG: hypothetical protein SNG27_01420 [Rikenellaceae bacterium]
MALTSVIKILDSVKSSIIRTRTLKNLEFERCESGEIFYRVGNNVVLFKILIDNRWATIRCYMRKTKHLKNIYGSNYLCDELYIYSSSTSGYWIDVVIGEWVDGETLLTKIEEGVDNNNQELLKLLADNFDKLAVELLDSESAHGDLTVENIIVTPSGELKLIDFDGAFIPELAGFESVEIGTAAFQSPRRTTRSFSRHMDDYSIALISTALRALSVKPDLYKKFIFRDGLMIEPQRVLKGCCEALNYMIEMFKDKNMNSAYRVAKLLSTSNEYIVQLREILYLNSLSSPQTSPQLSAPQSPLYVSLRNGFVGYTTAQGDCFIPHIYDDGLEFSMGEVAVCLDGRWMVLDCCGRFVRRIEK